MQTQIVSSAKAAPARPQLRAVAVVRVRSVVKAFLDEAATPAKAAPKAARAPRRVAPADGKAVKAAAKPKSVRAPTAYQLFQKDGFKQVIAANPEVKTFADRVRLVRAAWDALPEAQKQAFADEAAKKKVEVDAIKAAAAAEKKANSRPMSAFMLYSQEQRAKVRAANPTAKLPEVSKRLGAAWKALPEDERAVYQEVYKDNIARWESARAAKAQAQ